MIASGVVLFLFGTAVSAGPYIAPSPTEIIISKNKHGPAEKIVEYYPSSGQSPFISNFIQKGTNVFFKPQFILSASQLPPQIQPMIAAIQNDDCKTSYPMGPVPVMPVIEEPLRVIEKEIIASPDIKEVIDINPIPYPKVMPPMPLVVEEPCEVGPTYVPTVEIPVPPAPVIVEDNETKAPLVIPPAPVLPPMVMPKIPMIVEEVPIVAPVPEVPVMFEMEKSKEIVMSVIPPAPVLPAMEFPQVPMLVEEPCAPVEVNKPVLIPEGPVLPTYVPEPYVHEVLINEKTMGILQPPVVLMEEKVMPKFYETFEGIEPTQAMVIPEAPLLPPLAPVNIPTSQAFVEEFVHPAVIPEAPVLPPIAPVEVPPAAFAEEAMYPAVIPQAPELPLFEFPKMSVLQEHCVEEMNEIEPLVLPQAPLKTMYIDNFVQPMVIPQAPVLPPLAPVEIPTPAYKEEFVHPTVIPQAHGLPLLAPMEIPTPAFAEVAYPTVMPQAPELPPLEIPKVSLLVQDPCIEDMHKIEPVVLPPTPVLPTHIEEFIQPMVIPEAPLLPPLAPIDIPARIEEPLKLVEIPSAPFIKPMELPKMPFVDPCEIIEITEKHMEKVLIPEAPLLPPMEPLKFSTPIVVAEPILGIEKEAHLEETHVVKPVLLPSAPILPPLEITKKSAQALVAPCPPEDEVVVMPVPPKLPEVYVPYASQNFVEPCEDIVVEQILPKMKMALKHKSSKSPVPMHLTPLSYTVL